MSAGRTVCEERKDDLAALAAGALDERDAAAARAHVETCDVCRAYHDSMTRTVAAVRDLPRPEPSADTTRRILEAARKAILAPEPSSEPEPSWIARALAAALMMLRRPAFAAAAAGLAIAVAAIVTLRLRGDDAPPAAMAPPAAAVARAEPAAPAPVVPAEIRMREQSGAESEPPEERAETAADEPAASTTVGVDMPAGVHPAGRPPADARRGRRSGGSGTTADPRPPARGPARPGGAARIAEQAPAGETSATTGAGAGAGPAAGGDREARGRFSTARLVETQPIAGPADDLGAARDGATVHGVSSRTAGPQPRAAAPAQTPPRAQPWPFTAIGAGAASAPAAVADEREGPVAPARPQGGMAAMSGQAEARPAGSEQVAAEPAFRGRREDDAVDRARGAAAAGDLDAAEETLRRHLATSGERRAEATWLLAETYERRGEWSAAARTWDLFLARHMDDSRADEARWRAAAAYRRSGAARRAEELYRQLAGSPEYAARARAALDEMSPPPAPPAAAPPATESVP